MKTLLVTVDYSHNQDKWWWDSSIKKMKVLFDPEKQTIHELIKEVIEEEDGMELTYKGKPKGNIYRDVKDGESKVVGYLYRGKHEMYDRGMVKPVLLYWTVWVEIEEVVKFEIEELCC